MATTDGSNNYLAQIAASNGIALGANPLTTPTDPNILFLAMGKKTRGGLFPADMESPVRHQDPDRIVPVSVAQQEFTDASDGDIRRMALALALAGFAGVSVKDAKEAVQEASLDDVLSWHQKFLEGAALAYDMGHGKKITPEQFLRRRLEYRLGKKWDGKIDSLDSVATSASGGSLAGTHTTKASSVDFLSPEDARGLVRSTLQQELGRDPTEAEYEDFVAALRTAQERNPNTVTTTTTTDASGNVTSSHSRSSGGVDAASFLANRVQDSPEYAEWQAVGTYAPALFSALGSAIPGA